jgi:hypothetical protein
MGEVDYCVPATAIPAVLIHVANAMTAEEP